MFTQSIKKYLSTWYNNPSAVDKTFYLTSTCVAYLVTLIYTNVITSNLITPDSAMLFKTIIIFLKLSLIVGIYIICPHAWLYLLTLDHNTTDFLAGKNKVIYHFPTNKPIKFKPSIYRRLSLLYFISITLYLSTAWLCKFGTFEEYTLILQMMWLTMMILYLFSHINYVRNKTTSITVALTIAHATCAVGFFLFVMLILLYNIVDFHSLHLLNFIVILSYSLISTGLLAFNSKFSLYNPEARINIAAIAILTFFCLFYQANKTTLAIKTYEDMYISISACNILKLNGYNVNCNAHANYALLKNINVVSQDSQQIIFKYNDNKFIEHEYSLPISEVKSRQIKNKPPHTNLVISNIWT